MRGTGDGYDCVAGARGWLGERLPKRACTKGPQKAQKMRIGALLKEGEIYLPAKFGLSRIICALSVALRDGAWARISLLFNWFGSLRDSRLATKQKQWGYLCTL